MLEILRGNNKKIKKIPNMLMTVKLFMITSCSVCLSTVVLANDGFSGFKRSNNNTSYGFQRVSKPAPVRAGFKSQRFELRAGDCGEQNGWSDCRTDRSRSELRSNDVYYMGDERWFAWSIYVSPDFKDVDPTKITFGQIHQVGGPRGKYAGHPSFPPLLQFVVRDGNYTLTHHDLTGSRNNVIDRIQTWRLISLDDMRGRWVDIVLRIKFSKTDGSLDVFVNGERKAFMNRDVIKMPPEHFYFKYGIYNTLISAYQKRNKGTFPTQIVYYDEVRAGKKREDVDLRFNPSLRPVD